MQKEHHNESQNLWKNEASSSKVRIIVSILKYFWLDWTFGPCFTTQCSTLSRKPFNNSNSFVIDGAILQNSDTFDVGDIFDHNLIATSLLYHDSLSLY